MNENNTRSCMLDVEAETYKSFTLFSFIFDYENFYGKTFCKHEKFEQ